MAAPSATRVALSTATPAGPVLSAQATPFVPATAEPSTPSLTDIEAQRRQELLARKALQASRKKAAAAGATSSTPSAEAPAEAPALAPIPAGDVEMPKPLAAERPKRRTVVPHESVDDFLNSIGSMAKPQLVGDAAMTDVEHQVHSPESIAMDIDSPVDSFRLLDTPAVASADVDQLAIAQPIPLALGGIGVNTLEPSSATAEDAGSSTPRSSTSSSSASASASASADASADGHARRGTKRPVAADFDIEPAVKAARPMPVATESAPRAVHVSPTLSMASAHPLVRRKAGSFAGVSGMRRCVIDLSDDEEDDGGAADALDGQGAGAAQRLAAAANARAAAMSPAALEEKEREISRMREWIAKRELSRLRKSVVVSGDRVGSGGWVG